jgi:tetratricopeptide (TPR) repeat protein
MNVERRALLKATLGAASGAMLPFELSNATQGRRIGMSVVRDSWAALGRFHTLERTLGGGVVYNLTTSMATQLKGALTTATYSGAVGRSLRQVNAAVMIQAGWQAFDAGRPKVARRWWLETLDLCDTESDAGQWRFGALAALASEASKNPNRGCEVIELTQLAAQVRGASPAMLSLIAARESLGHACLGDAAGVGAALTHANKLLDHTRIDEEPPDMLFWGPADLACHEMTAARNLGQGSAAVRAAQQAVELCDPVGMPRNHALYLAYLGHALAQVGQYDEAIEPLQGALTSPARHGSQRITKKLREASHLLGRARSRPAQEFAATLHQLL